MNKDNDLISRKKVVEMLERMLKEIIPSENKDPRIWAMFKYDSKSIREAIDKIQSMPPAGEGVK